MWGPNAWLRRSPNSSNGGRFPIGSASALRAPALFRILWRASFGSVARVFWNTRQNTQRSIPESPSSSGSAFWSGRTKGSLQNLSLRTGATRSVIMRHEIGGWISFGSTGSDVGRNGRGSLPWTFHASRVGARPRSSPICLDLLRFYKLRYPKGGVLVEQVPVYAFGVIVQKGLQRILCDPTVSLFVK